MRQAETNRDARAADILAGMMQPGPSPAEAAEAPGRAGDGAMPAGGAQALARTRRVDVLQLLFWLSITVAIAAATVSIAWHEAVGEAGSILLIALAATGMVVLLWLARGAGRWLGLFPERGAAEHAVAQHAMKPRFPWIESLDEAVLVTERGGAPVTCNGAFHKLSELAAGLGESHGPVTVDRLFGGSPGLAAAIYRLAKAAKSAQSRTEILPAMALGRDEKAVQFAASVAPLPGGKVIWRLRDITGQDARSVAADPKALYIEDAPVGFFVARADGSITYLNGWLRELLGLPEGDSVSRVDDIMRADSVRMLKREKRGDNMTRAQLTLIARDGVEVPVQAVTTWSGKGLDAAGRTVLTTAGGSVIDRAARAMAASASRPARTASEDPMFDDAPFGVVRLDGGSVDHAVIIDANPAMMSLTQGRGAPGTRFADLFMADDTEAVLADKLVDAIDHAVLLQLAGKDGTPVNVRLALDPGGAPSIAYVMDMTAQRELEARVYQGAKMQALGNFAGEMAHDFNNVLTGIILNTDKLMIRHPVGDPSYRELKEIHELSARAAERIAMIKAYARKETLKRQIFDPTEWLTEFSLMLRQLVDERVTINIRHGRDLPKIRFDKNQLETCMLNLATNARDAMEAKGGGTLTVSTEAVTADDAHARGFSYVEGGDYLLIRVSDTGTGISPDNMERIFEPFFTTKDKTRGTGLGLSSVYGIMKQSGAYVCPESEVGTGTTFNLYIPALSAEEAAMAPEEPAPRAPRMRRKDVSGRGRILLVEDEHAVRTIASTLLRSCGYEVTDAADGEKALAIIEARPNTFDLLISDVLLPGMDGPTLFKRARPLLGDARVLFISGFAERDFAQALEEEADISFLPKPFTLALLAERVKELMAPVEESEQAA